MTSGKFYRFLFLFTLYTYFCFTYQIIYIWTLQQDCLQCSFFYASIVYIGTISLELVKEDFFFISGLSNQQLEELLYATDSDLDINLPNESDDGWEGAVRKSQNKSNTQKKTVTEWI